MRTKWLTGIGVLVLLIIIVVTVCPSLLEADSVDSVGFDSGVRVFSPVNMTYYYNNLILNLSLNGAGMLGSLDPQISMNYNIDGLYNGSVPLRSNGETHVVTVALATVNLPKLPDGSHCLTIYLNGLNQRTHEPKYVSYITRIYFSTVDETALNSALSPTIAPTPYLGNSTIFEPIVSFTQWHTNSPVIQPPANRLADIPPVVEIVSPENQTIFQTSKVTLTVNVASYFWIIDSVYYQADWQEGGHKIFGVQPNYTDALNATITATFTQIPNGNHTVEISANTHDNMHTLSTVTFFVQNTIPTPTPTIVPTSTPTTNPKPASTIPEFSLIAILLPIASTLVFALFVKYRQVKKRRHCCGCLVYNKRTTKR